MRAARRARMRGATSASAMSWCAADIHHQRAARNASARWWASAAAAGSSRKSTAKARRSGRLAPQRECRQATASPIELRNSTGRPITAASTLAPTARCGSRGLLQDAAGDRQQRVRAHCRAGDSRGRFRGHHQLPAPAVDVGVDCRLAVQRAVMSTLFSAAGGHRVHHRRRTTATASRPRLRVAAASTRGPVQALGGAAASGTRSAASWARAAGRLFACARDAGLRRPATSRACMASARTRRHRLLLRKNTVVRNWVASPKRPAAGGRTQRAAANSWFKIDADPHPCRGLGLACGATV